LSKGPKERNACDNGTFLVLALCPFSHRCK